MRQCTFGQLMRALRYSNDIKLRELAHLTGVSEVMLNAYEQDWIKPSDEVVESIAASLEQPAFIFFDLLR